MAAPLEHKVGLFIWREMLATVFGLTVLWSGASLTTLVMLFSAYALADGLLALIVRRYRRWDSGHNNRGLLLRGVVGIAIGGITFLRPNVAVLLPSIAVWAILTGAIDIIAVLRLRSAPERSQQIGWDAMIKRQRQITWDGAVERTMYYAHAERMARDNEAERNLRCSRAVRLGDGLRAKPVGYTAQSAGRHQWGQSS